MSDDADRADQTKAQIEEYRDLFRHSDWQLLKGGRYGELAVGVRKRVRWSRRLIVAIGILWVLMAANNVAANPSTISFALNGALVLIVIVGLPLLLRHQNKTLLALDAIVNDSAKVGESEA